MLSQANREQLTELLEIIKKPTEINPDICEKSVLDFEVEDPKEIRIICDALMIYRPEVWLSIQKKATI